MPRPAHLERPFLRSPQGLGWLLGGKLGLYSCYG